MKGAMVYPMPDGASVRVEPTCAVCSHSAIEYGHQQSWMECRANAPSLGPVSCGIMQRWPKVNRNEWCGSHQFDAEKTDRAANQQFEQQQAASRDAPTWQKDSAKTN